jgi:hypothetical protein
MITCIPPTGRRFFRVLYLPNGLLNKQFLDNQMPFSVVHRYETEYGRANRQRGLAAFSYTLAWDYQLSRSYDSDNNSM